MESTQGKITAPALSAEELIAWVDKTAANWHTFVTTHPAVPSLACDIYKDTQTVAGLLHHIAAVELRYAQRLAALPEITYDSVPLNIDSTPSTSKPSPSSANASSDPTYDWDCEIEFNTISIGKIAATRRIVLIHLLMHAIRHYAQLATLVRQHGFKTDFLMDYLIMGARKALTSLHSGGRFTEFRSLPLALLLLDYLFLLQVQIRANKVHVNRQTAHYGRNVTHDSFKTIQSAGIVPGLADDDKRESRAFVIVLDQEHVGSLAPKEAH